jgi:hypothetical protein
MHPLNAFLFDFVILTAILCLVAVACYVVASIMGALIVTLIRWARTPKFPQLKSSDVKYIDTLHRARGVKVKLPSVR